MNIPSNLKYTKDHEWILIDAAEPAGAIDEGQGLNPSIRAGSGSIPRIARARRPGIGVPPRRESLAGPPRAEARGEDEKDPRADGFRGSRQHRHRAHSPRIFSRSALLRPGEPLCPSRRSRVVLLIREDRYTHRESPMAKLSRFCRTHAGPT